MQGRAAAAAIAVLIVASCSTAAAPDKRGVEPAPSSIPLVTSPATSGLPVATVSPSLVASVEPPAVHTASPPPQRTLRLDDVVTRFALVGPGSGWAETNHGLLVTADDGLTWADVTPGGVDSPVALDAIDGQVAFLASRTDDGSTTTITIWRTTNAGRTWRPAKVASLPTPDAPSDCGCEHMGVSIDAVDPLDVFADIAISSGTDSESHDVVRSRDGGVTWTPVRVGIEANGSPADLAIHFLTADIGSLVFDNRTFTTRTGWGHWSEYPEPAFGAIRYLDDRHWIMGLPDVFAGTIRIADSTDAGLTWTTYARPLPATTNALVSFVSGSTWIATIETASGQAAGKLGPPGIWISRDGGTGWKLVGNLPTKELTRSQFVDPSHAWVLTPAGGVATTSDGGATWSTILGPSTSGG